MKHFTYIKIIIPLMLLLPVMANAGNDIQTQIKPVWSGNAPAITVGGSVEIIGNRYNSSLGTSISNRNISGVKYYTERAYGIIELSSPGLYQSSITGSASVKVNIEYEIIDDDGNAAFASIIQTLKLDADGSKVIDVAYYKVEGAEHIKATITEINIPSGWPDINIEASVVTESFNELNIASPSINLGHDANLTAGGNLKINWDALTGAEGYDLEWTYVSNQAEDAGSVLLPNQIEVDPFLFRYNSSRVSLPDTNSFEIPLMYETGYILYRIRGTGKRLANGAVVKSATEWTVLDGAYSRLDQFPSLNLYLYAGLEQNLNWNSTLAFAEEGKNKTLLSYHDGSLRNRQAIIRINTDKRAIVGETFYDYQGKPVIEVLPAPVPKNNLTYYTNFNIIEGDAMLLKENYTNDNEGEGCVVKSPILVDTTGASNYYSPQNKFHESVNNNVADSIINRKLIPDAHKFPYTQTKYTPDNTGRIAAESGVGIAHTIGSGHETKNFYGSAQQEELSRLFGNQVGYFLHYKKDLAVDPNGQVSVTYKNLDGKVIATTLVGTKPPNLDELPGESRNISTNLFGGSVSSNELSIDGLSKNYSSKFTVAENNVYDFNYTASLGSIDVSCFLATTSFDGVVDLKIQLVNGCGEVVFTVQDNTDPGHTGTNQSMQADREDVPLAQGEYVLTKELSINEAELDKYWEDYLGSSPECFRLFQDFSDEEIENLDLLGCDLTCDKCKEEQQRRLNDPTKNYTEAEIAAINNLCKRICDEEVGCITYINAMLGDLSPGGQYGEVRVSKLKFNKKVEPELDENGDFVIEEVGVEIRNPEENDDTVVVDAENPDDNKFNPSHYPLSIYNAFNSLPLSKYTRGITTVIRPSWQKPLRISDPDFTGDNTRNDVIYEDNGLDNATYFITDYRDKNGDTVYAFITRRLVLDLGPFGKIYDYTPNITDASKLVPVDVEGELFKIPLRYLSSAKEFNKYWQQHFAQYLLPYHPEYGYLVDCSENYHESHDFDYLMSSTNTIAEAVSKGYVINNTPVIVGATQQTSLDPFIINTSSYYKAIKKRNDVFDEADHSMAEFATFTANCSRTGLDPTCPVVNCYDGIIDTDQEWIIYKGFYLSEKQELIEKSATDKSVLNYYYNGCIGNKDFLSSPKSSTFLNTIYSYSPIYQSECEAGSINSLDIREWTCIDSVRKDPVFIITFPWIDPRQVCYSDRYALFEEKDKRFFPDGGFDDLQKNCEIVSEAGTADEIVIPRVCNDDLIEAVNESIKEGQRYRFVTCGTCPMAADLDDVLFALFEKELLVSPTETHLTCSSDSVQVGGELYRKFAETSTDISWQSTLSPDGKTLSGAFLLGNISSVNLTLTIPPGLPGVTFNALSKLCCIKVDTINGNLFTLEGTYFNILGFSREKFDVSGSFGYRLDTCTITPRCLATENSENVSSFLNMLIITRDKKLNDLVTGSSTTLGLLSPDPNNASNPRAASRQYYAGVVRSLINRDFDLEVFDYLNSSTLLAYNPRWNSVIANGGLTLDGVFTYTENSVNKQIPISITSPTLVSFSQILGFSRIRPFRGDANKFIVDALISVGDLPSDNVYQEMVIETPSLVTTVCDFPIPPLN